jgi:methylmalonyl-CoA mutase
LTEKFKESGLQNSIVTIGGVIPPQDYQQLHDHGVKLIYVLGTRISETAIRIPEVAGKALTEVKRKKRMFSSRHHPRDLSVQ